MTLLTALAQTTDLPVKWQSDPTATRALAVASAAVRDAAGASISQTISTISVTGTDGRLLILPRPTISVDSVSILGVTITDYTLLPEGLWRRDGWAVQNFAYIPPTVNRQPGDPTVVTVTGTFGYATVPADIVDLTVQLATAWLQHQAEGGGSIAGIAQVRLDDAQETYTAEASGNVTPVFIPEVTKVHLAARFGVGGMTILEGGL